MGVSAKEPLMSITPWDVRMIVEWAVDERDAVPTGSRPG